MSYNWTKADTAEARERLKARLDQGTVIARRIMAEIDGKPMYSNPIELWMQNGEYFTSDSVMKNPFTVTHKHVWNLEFLDPNPAHLSIPSNEAISAASKDFKEMFEAVFASSLRLVAIDYEMLQKGFEAGAKWMVEQMNINQCPAS